MTKSRNQSAQPAPHSWSARNWPAGVYPHDNGKGRYLIRCNRSALVSAGALIRVGRDLVVLGGPFSRWLESQGSRVEGFNIAANRAQPSAA